MAMFMKVFKSETAFFKHCPLSIKNTWNVESAFSVKKVEIPVPPKRPLSAYMIFCKENRGKLLKQEPNLTSTQQIQRLAAKWGELDIDMKKPYEISARQGNVVYGEAHKKFYENLTAAQKEELARQKEEKKESRRKLKLKRALQKSGLPKAPSSSYALFVKSEASKAKGNTEKATNFFKETAEKWSKLTPEVKASFEKEAIADKKRYESEMATWLELMKAENNSKLLQQYEERKSKRKLSTEK